jgi:hypothetical protein
MKLTMGKTRTLKDPYLKVYDGNTGFDYAVLKAYSADPDKPFARWFVAVKSPMTFGGYDMGDTYVADVTGTVTFRDPAVSDADLPSHLKGGPKPVNPLDLLGF